MQTIIVDMTPGFRMPTIYYSQGDVGTQFAIDLRSRFGDSFPTGTTVTIQATKPSGFGFSVSADSTTGGLCVFTTTAEMTDEFGRFPAELKVTKTGLTLFSANFYMDGEINTHPDGTIDGQQETVIPELAQLVERVEDAASSVLDMTVVANTLPAGSDATYSYDEETNTATFGIPKGADGSLASGVLAPTYSSSSTYAVGDYVYYSGILYRCTTAITTAEAWTSGHWTQVALAPEVSDLKSEVGQIDKGIKVYTDGWTDANYYNGQGQLITANTYWRTDFIPVADFEKVNINKNGLGVYCAYFDSSKVFQAMSGATYNTGDSYTLATSYPYVVIEIAKSTGNFNDIDIVGYINKAINNDVVRSEISYNNLLIDTTLENKLTAIHGKNLYNPDTFNQLEGFYFAYNNGIRTANSGFMAVVIPVTAGDVLSFNKGNIHVCAVSKVPDLSYFADHSGKLDGYISGFADVQPKQNYTVPNGCVCLVVSNPKTDKLSIQVEVGSASTSFEAYYSKLKATDIIGINADFIVGQGLLYETITDAINDASDGDTIYVTPGTYTEAIDARGKNIKIKGFSRDSCILTYPASDYLEPPLEMAKGVVEDMTIIATGSTLAPGATFLAYCVHIDFGEERNNSLQFKNCRFVNEARQCVGIGMRGNYRLSFINCEFECNTDGCVYLHEEQASNVSGQYVEFIDCSMKRNSIGDVIRMQESPGYTDNVAIVRFQRNILVNLGGTAIVMQQYGSQPGLTGDGYLGSTNWILDTASALNNNSLLDA